MCLGLRRRGVVEADIARVRGPIGLFGPTRDATSFAVSALPRSSGERHSLDGTLPMLLRQTAAILLAAGRSLRHPGQHKLCRDLDGRPLGLHAAATIAALAPAVRIAVCSEPTRDLAAGLSALGFQIAWNDDPGRGLATSIAAGVRSPAATRSRRC